MRKKCLNIGCGWDTKKSNIKESWVNIDVARLPCVDIVKNMDTDRLPFKTSSVDYVYCKWAFEHFSNWQHALQEMVRVTKPSGVIHLILPYGYCKQDCLFHKTQGYHETTFNKLDADLGRHYYTKFHVKTLKIKRNAYGMARFIPFKGLFCRFFNNVYCEIEYFLRPQKGKIKRKRGVL